MRDILTKNKEIPDNDRREIDDRGMILLFRTCGFVPASIEADRMKLIYVFSRSETQELLGRILSNDAIMIEWQKYLSSEEEWKHALSALRELRGQ